jgi:hypothetical protein
MYFDRAAGMANNAAATQTPQNVATLARHDCCEEKRTWWGFTVTMYRWMTSQATEYTDRPTDIRLQNERNVHVMSLRSHMMGIIFAQASEKNTVK